ncbi:MAG: tetratricopeptide repeat protein [Candidatus Wallbacteria bacterium]
MLKYFPMKTLQGKHQQLLEQIINNYNQNVSGTNGIVIKDYNCGTCITDFLFNLSRSIPRSIFIDCDAKSSLPFSIPYAPFFHFIYSYALNFDNYKGINPNKIEKLSKISGLISLEKNLDYSTFDLMKSFYGFKHDWNESGSCFDIYQEFKNIIDFISNGCPIIFHIKNSNWIDIETAHLINFIFNNNSNTKIIFIFSMPAGTDFSCAVKSMPGALASVCYDYERYQENEVMPLSLKHKNCNDHFKKTLSLFNESEISVITIASIFLDYFRVSDVAKASLAPEETVKTILDKAAEHGIIYKLHAVGFYCFTSDEIQKYFFNSVAKPYLIEINNRILDNYSKIKLPDIGLAKLIYHCLMAENYEIICKLSLKLAAALCELKQSNKALKIFKFLRLIIFPKIKKIEAGLKIQTYILQIKTMILAKKYKQALIEINECESIIEKNISAASKSEYLLELYKWLSFVYIQKPSLDNKNEGIALKHLQHALSLSMSSVKQRVDVNNLFGMYFYRQSDLERAGIFYRDSIKTLSVSKYGTDLWLDNDSAYRGLSSIYLRQGEFRKAFAYLKKCEENCINFNQQRMLANTLQYIGMIHHNRGEYDAAIENYTKGLNVLETLLDKSEQSRIWTSLGVTYFNLARYDEALTYFNKTLEFAQLTSNKRAIAILKGNLARIYMIHGDFSAAANALDDDIALLKEIGDKFGLAYAYNYAGDLYFMKSEPKTALEYYRKAYEIALKSKFLNPLILSSIGIIQALPFDKVIDSGKSIINELILIDSREIDIVSKSLILRARCIYECLCGIGHRATCFINQALINFEKINMPLETALCLIDESKIFKLNGMVEASEAKIKIAIQIFKKINAKFYIEKYSE